MKKIILGFGVLALLVLPAVGQDKEEDRVAKAGTVIKEILDIPDDVPQDTIDRADCVVVLPSVLKFAFGIGGSYGRGVMTCRGGKNFHGPWSAPTMMALEGASFGLQLGGQATDFVLADEFEIGVRYFGEQGEAGWRRLGGCRTGGTECFG